MPEHQELGVLGHLVPGQHHEAAEQTAHEQVDGREDHSGMISPPKTSSATPDRVTEPRALLENEQVTTRIAFPSSTGPATAQKSSMRSLARAVLVHRGCGWTPMTSWHSLFLVSPAMAGR